MHRAQRPIPADAQAILNAIPFRFIDDGATNAPDGICGFEFRWASRIHDWRYDTRSHPPIEMTQAHRHLADAELERNVRSALPWRYRWIGWVYFAAVDRFGGDEAWNSCGPEAGVLCRHNMPLPPWLMVTTEPPPRAA